MDEKFITCTTKETANELSLKYEYVMESNGVFYFLNSKEIEFSIDEFDNKDILLTSDICL